jgi:uncharacterized RDD family membrane protein YckC
MSVAAAPKPRRNGVVAAAGRGTARLVLYPVRAGLRSSAGAEARRELGDAAVDALAAPEVEHLVDRLLAGPFPEAVARSIVENHVAERVVREALRRADLDAAITSALQSEEADALVERALNTPAFRRALEETLASPAVRAALTRQSSDAAQDALGRMRTSLDGMDASLERGPRRLFGRAARVVEPAEAGFATRGFALAVDAALVNLAFLAGVALVGLVASLAGGLPTWLQAVLSGVGLTIAVAAYFVFFWSVSGSTPGMALVGVRVVTTDGRPLRPARAFVRLAGLLLSIAILFLGFLPVLVSDRRQALQDDIAGTVVIREGR